jgi:predicted O-methyltransferase YrrM
MTRDPIAPSRSTYIARALKGATSNPGDGAQKVMEKLSRRRERRARNGRLPSNSAPADWERRLHELLGAPWPCRHAAEFSPAWDSAIATMAERGLRVGRKNYGGDDDADPGLARTLWCLVWHMRPAHVVETGVAHGLSSRILLDALEHADAGRLWSIDLPPMTITERRVEVGAAVPADLRKRWTYLEGSSRRRLPPLLRQLGQVELFCHDSLHSTRNVRWELTRAWDALAPGGVVVVDDVDHNWGFEEFLGAGDDRQALFAMADDRQRVFAIARKAPAGVALPSSAG